MMLARYRYRGQVFELQTCLAPDALARVLKSFPDGVIDWEAVQSMPYVESTPEQRADIERRLARAYEYQKPPGADAHAAELARDRVPLDPRPARLRADAHEAELARDRVDPRPARLR